MRVRHILYLGLGFLIFNLAISYLATRIIPYLGYFSFPNLLDSWNLPDFVKRFTSFDGLHYINIAQNGYERNEVAFFPLYPLLIYLTAKGLDYPIAALLISYLSLVITLLVVPMYLSSIGVSKKNSLWYLIFLLTFPTSFFLQSAYSESFFVLLILLTLFFNKKNNTLATILFGFLAGMTRVVGIFLTIPLFFSNRRLIRVISPVLGFLSYASYLWFLTGDPLKFFHVQPQFGASRTTKLILLPQVIYRYLKIFLTADFNYQYFVAAVEFGIFIMVLIALVYDLFQIYKRKIAGNSSDRLGLNLFGLAMLILPSLTGTFLSIPRFVLPILTLYLVLSEMKNTVIKLLIASLFLLLHMILLMFFIQGYFVS